LAGSSDLELLRFEFCLEVRKMPIYEYRCAVCGAVFDRMASFGDDAGVRCPNGHTDTQKVFSPPGIVFKGSGFYVNDSRSNGKSGGSDD
jgi:putative FmdB family regulatory protein